jgi:hypothetical protein
MAIPCICRWEAVASHRQHLLAAPTELTPTRHADYSPPTNATSPTSRRHHRHLVTTAASSSTSRRTNITSSPTPRHQDQVATSHVAADADTNAFVDRASDLQVQPHD